MLTCGLTAETLPSVDMRISTPLGIGSPRTKLVKSVEIEIEELHLPVDMLVLPMSDFDVILGMDWLTQYRVVIDCHEMTLSFKIRGVEVEYKLEKPRPPSMHTKELWERPMVASLTVDGRELTMDIVPIAR